MSMAGSATPRGLLLWSDMGAVLLQDSRSAPRALRLATSLAGATVPVSGLGCGVHDNQPTWPQQPQGDVRRRQATCALAAGQAQDPVSDGDGLDRRVDTWPGPSAGSVRPGATVRVMP